MDPNGKPFISKGVDLVNRNGDSDADGNTPFADSVRNRYDYNIFFRKKENIFFNFYLQHQISLLFSSLLPLPLLSSFLHFLFLSNKRYGTNYEAWGRDTATQVTSWGMNTFGAWSDYAMVFYYFFCYNINNIIYYFILYFIFIYCYLLPYIFSLQTNLFLSPLPLVLLEDGVQFPDFHLFPMCIFI